MPFYKVPVPVNVSGGQQHQVVKNEKVIFDVDNGSVVQSSSDELDSCSLRSISDRSSSFAELTEVDRDSELLRRDLENQIHQHISADPNLRTNKSDSHNSNRKPPRPASNLIELELAELRQRELEFAAMHQSIHDSSSSSRTFIASPTSDTADKDSGIAGDYILGNSGNSRYAHPGESRIVQELTEQKMREEELRGHWKNMGLVISEACELKETPFTLPEPRQTMNHVQKTTTQSQNFTSDTTKSRNSSSLETQQNLPKVRPFDDQDLYLERKMTYIPAEETPIEREIRLVKEREAALRQSRGLPPLPAVGTTGEMFATEVLLDDTNCDQQDSHYNPSKISMTKLANSRLQMEFKREKKREMDLKTQGAIHTISEERVGEQKKYVEILPPGCGQNSDRTTPCWMKNSNSKESVVIDDRNNHEKLVTEEQSKESLSVKGGKSKGQTIQEEHDRVVAEISELALVQKNRSSRPKSMVIEMSAAEMKIERELQEMKQREEELRHQRGSVSGSGQQ